MFTSKTTKTELQESVERLEKQVAEQSEKIDSLNRDIERHKSSIERKDSRIESLNASLSNAKSGRDEAQKQAREYKQELDGLKDVKSILSDLKARFASPLDALNRRIAELESELQMERNRSMEFEVNTQRNHYLEGKVQAYEAVLHTANRAAPFYPDNQEQYNKQD